ncbi:ABC transporter permease subunit [Micromonospora sp. KC606]|uniref:ABC transporter permease subunit n=1 Tax=Micromonospora sp. KC606 TaxID=2530379 RepID=UPI001050FD6E|nr:ABC transporter permease subunit [Micromonospora sp. KC606]TDC85430.1 ABC transporter permease subunit [Micromonospora sp. KC606]
MSRANGLLLATCSRLVALLALLALVGALPWLSGRDPARSILRAQYGESVPDPAALAAIREKLRLDDGPLVLFGRWLAGVLRGDLGTSWVTGTPVAPTVWSALGVSLTLMGAALAVALVVAALLVLRGLWRGRTTRRGGALGAALTSIPEFLLGIALLLVVAVWLEWADPYGWSAAHHAVLPALALGIPAGGLLGRLADDAIPGAFREPWVRTWATGGLPRRTIAYGVLRRSLPALFPQFTIVVVGLTGGAVLVEVLFAIPGLGRLALGAAAAQDLPAVQGAVLALAVLAAAVSVLAAVAQRLAVGPALDAAGLQPPPPDPGPRVRRVWLVPGVLGGVLLAVVLAGLLRDPTHVDTGLRLAAPSWDAALGRDALGRDLLARLGHGALRTVGVAVAVSAVAFALGVAAGLLPRLTQGAAELVNAVPPVLVGLITAAAFGPSTGGAAVAVAATAWAPLALHVAALVREELASGYVQACWLLGASRIRVLAVHVLPGVLPPVIRHALLRLPGVALAIASLGFVGLGTQPPTPEWGRILAEAMPYVERAPWAALSGAAALALLGALSITASTALGVARAHRR